MENEEDKLKDELVKEVQRLAALLSIYSKVLKFDAYECTLEFMFTDGEGRIRLTDSRYKTDPKSGKLVRLPNPSSDPDASSLDDAEARRRKGHKTEEEEVPEAVVEVKKTPEQVVKEMMKKLRLKG
jgi:hypothetical protein